MVLDPPDPLAGRWALRRCRPDILDEPPVPRNARVRDLLALESLLVADLRVPKADPVMRPEGRKLPLLLMPGELDELARDDRDLPKEDLLLLRLKLEADERGLLKLLMPEDLDALDPVLPKDERLLEPNEERLPDLKEERDDEKLLPPMRPPLRAARAGEAGACHPAGCLSGN